LKESTSLPVLLFPGSAAQISRHADGILFLTLLSGRNPQFLAEEQVRSAPRVKEFALEPIPTGYLLVGRGGRSVHFVSGTQPIPAERPELVMAHALAAQYMGMRAVYLEAGSGAEAPVPPEVIRAVRGYIDVPLLVGGGIRNAAQADEARAAGADILVVGHALEEEGASAAKIRSLAEAIHGRRMAGLRSG
jgi:phosphoglycerol geranylgeranyltransferase